MQGPWPAVAEEEEGLAAAASALGSVWTEFVGRMAAAPDTRLTPAYDLTLAYAVANWTKPHFAAVDPTDGKTVVASGVSLASMVARGAGGEPLSTGAAAVQRSSGPSGGAACPRRGSHV